jgi:isovaleryl-CoA dehydrogenase
MNSEWTKTDLFNPTEEHLHLRSAITSFVQKEVEPQALEYDRAEKFNLKLLQSAAKLGLLGITVHHDYGGISNGDFGFDAVASVIAHEEISYSDPGFCLAYLAHSLLCANNLAVNGSHEQKLKFLPKLCSAEFIGAMGMSEPNAGTDVLGMRTTAIKSDSGYAINGNKMWITNGTIDEGQSSCDVALVYARTNSLEEKRVQLSTFIVEKGTKGFSVGQKIRDKTGMRASNTAELVFNQCLVPSSNLVGTEGDSIIHMMKNLEIERIGLAAMSVGIARRALDTMINYAKNRKAFNKNLYEFGQIQRYIAESYAELQAARCYLYNTARQYDPKNKNQRLDSDGIKLFATPIGKNIADRAMQVLGGNGYVGEYVVERLWRDAKLLEIGGGTLEAHQKNITNELVRSK